MKSEDHIITLKPVEPDDWEELSSWWEARHQDVPPSVLMPDMGVIASNGDYRAAAWLYLDATGVVSFLHWFVTNPKNTTEISRLAARVICDFFESYAKERGYKTIVSTMTSESLLREAEAIGWISDGATYYQAAKPLE